MSQSLFGARTRLTITLTVLLQCLLHCDKFLQFDDLPNYLDYLATPFFVTTPTPRGPQNKVKMATLGCPDFVRTRNQQAKPIKKIDYWIISQLLINYHQSDVMHKKFHPPAQMLSCSNIVLSSNFDPPNFFSMSQQNLSVPIIFFKNTINSKS